MDETDLFRALCSLLLVVFVGLKVWSENTRTHTPCPAQCSCSEQQLEQASKLMHMYVSRYRVQDADLESKIRRIMMTWTFEGGTMANIECHLQPGKPLSLTRILRSSDKRFKALTLTCQEGARVIWDLHPDEDSIIVLDIFGCRLEVPWLWDDMVLPIKLLLLHLERVPFQDVESLNWNTATHLKIIAWINSNLTSLPAQWDQTSLRYLLVVFLAHNQLTSFDCELKSLHLAVVNLDHNRLTELPSCILAGFKYTDSLSISHNRLKTLEQLAVSASQDIPTWQILRLGGLRSPSFIDVSHNQISYLPPLRSMQQLLWLDISSNSLDSISSKAFSLLPALQRLDLSNNGLRSLPSGLFNGLEYLRYLNLSRNRFQKFDFSQSPLSTNLLELDLRYNRMAHPPFSNTGYVAPRHTEIKAANNPYTCDCRMGTFVEFINAPKKTMPEDWFSLASWLRYFSDKFVHQPFIDKEELTCSHPEDMKGQHLVSLNFKTACRVVLNCPAECRCALLLGANRTRQTFVDCSRRENLKELPDTLPVIPNSRVILRMSWSGLRRIDHRPYLPYLAELDAAYSRVSVVTAEAVEAMQSITVLGLHNNLLSSLPEAAKTLSLANLSLAHNPWACGCDDLWMPRWLEEHSGVVNNMNGTRCFWTGMPLSELKASGLNCGVFTHLPLTVTLSMMTGLAVILVSLLVKFRLEVLVFVYACFGVRPFDV